MKKVYPILSAALLVVLFSFSSFAQRGVSSGIQRFEIGYSFPMTTATYTQHYKSYNEYSDDNLDTTMSKNVRTKGGFGITLGHFFPVAKMGEKSSLNISIAFLYNLLVWDADLVSVDGYDESTGSYSYNTNYVISAATVHWGLPMGVDFKTGGEATLDRSNRMSLTLGTGVYPSMNLTVFETNAGAKFKIQPYLKADVGIFAGINWKVRALYSFGKLDYIGYKESDEGSSYSSEYSTSLVSKSCLTLSLIVMPGSFKWGRSQWWN